MASEDTLPEGVCYGLARLVERATAVASDALLISQIAALRRCFDDAVSRVLAGRNARKLVLPDDVWPLVLEHLPLDDLLSASRTCRKWRALSLAHSRLWTRLVLHAVRHETYWHITNVTLGVLKNVLPRSRDHLLDLDIRISIPSPDERGVECDDKIIQDCLDLVAPRLAWLTITSDVPRAVGLAIDQYSCVFPELRELRVPPPSSDWIPEEDAHFLSFNRTRMPKLVELDLRADMRMVCFTSGKHWSALRILRCAFELFMDIEQILLSAGGLQHLILYWAIMWIDEFEQPSAGLLAALHAVPDLHVTTKLSSWFEEVVFDVFGRSPAPRLHLAFDTCDHDDGPLKLRPLSRLLSAVHLTISVRGDDTVIVAHDGANRETVISLRGASPTNALHPAIDWEMIPSFEALEQLSVDAALWPPDFMHNFPGCPRLSGITLAVRTLDDIRALPVDQQGLPQAESLNLMLEPDVELSEDRVDALKTVFGASQVALN